MFIVVGVELKLQAVKKQAETEARLLQHNRRRRGLSIWFSKSLEIVEAKLTFVVCPWFRFVHFLR